MKKNILWVLVAISFISCDQSGFKKQRLEDRPDSTEMEGHTGIEHNLNLQMDVSEQIDTSGMVMFPLSMKSTEEDRSSEYKKIPHNMYWNIVFYNSRSGDYHLLSDSMKLLVNDFGYNNPTQRDKLPSRSKLFFNLTVDDMNKDGMLNGADPNYLFITDKQGRNLQRISPIGSDFFNWYVIDGSEVVIMMVRKDSNKDNAFDEEDEKPVFRFEIGKDSIPVEIFSGAFKDQLKKMFHRDWRKAREE